jgi:hypothetical protein
MILLLSLWLFADFAFACCCFALAASIVDVAALAFRLYYRGSGYFWCRLRCPLRLLLLQGSLVAAFAFACCCLNAPCCWLSARLLLLCVPLLLLERSRRAVVSRCCWFCYDSFCCDVCCCPSRTMAHLRSLDPTFAFASCCFSLACCCFNDPCCWLSARLLLL